MSTNLIPANQLPRPQRRVSAAQRAGLRREEPADLRDEPNPDLPDGQRLGERQRQREYASEPDPRVLRYTRV